MTLVKLSAKGQLVIPKIIRETLGLHPGAQLEIQLKDQKIILEPVDILAPLETLFGKYGDADFLTELEAEHQQELQNETVGG